MKRSRRSVALDQDEDDEHDHHAGCDEGGDQRSGNGAEDLEGAQLGLLDDHRHRAALVGGGGGKAARPSPRAGRRRARAKSSTVWVTPSMAAEPRPNVRSELSLVDIVSL